ncbi:MAG: DUF2800 domain-containing protein [Eubacterium sp.]|nr:DUF2800 domain-containing protein [Eubacterium sp.]MCH4078861.1 DUF2800 domain-containing protein [Eubacterium sp.]
MPARNHAILSPSSAERWLHCTRAPRFELDFADKETPAAAEGTAAHALAEHKLKKALKMRSRRPISSFDSDEMEGFTDDYRDYILEQWEKEKQTCPDAKVYVETKLDLTRYVPGSFGTSDCIIVSDSRLHVIDFKYGQGIVVKAEENPQMKLYALGALDLYEHLYDFEEVSMTIFQPRRENISTWTESVKELKKWAIDVLKPKAKLANEGNGDFCCGDWCLFCKAAVKCRARAEANLSLARKEFALPPKLTDEEIEELLPLLPRLTKWANDISSYASNMAIHHGKKWKNWKLVHGRSNRKYKDESAVIKAAEKAGFHDIYIRKLISITEMEKLMGKKTFQNVLGSLVVKPPGKLTLVPSTDKRPEVNIENAKEEFKTLEEEK